MTRNLRSLFAVCALLLGASTVAQAAVTAQDLQGRIRKKIAEKWDTKNLVVKVVPYTSAELTRKGQFSQISVSADSAERRGKHIKVMGLAISAKGVQIDLNALAREGDVEILSRKSGTFKAKLYEADINRLLAMKDSSIENLRADFGNGTITFMGKYTFNIKLTGTIEIKNTYELHFKPTKASIGILGVPVGIVNKFLDRLNPVIDMREVPLKPQLKTINITDTYISVSG